MRPPNGRARGSGGSSCSPASGPRRRAPDRARWPSARAGRWPWLHSPSVAAPARGKRLQGVSFHSSRERSNGVDRPEPRRYDPAQSFASAATAGEAAMAKHRISYVDPDTISDPKMKQELDRCRREGTPRPESSAVRAHVPADFWSVANTWRDVFKNGILDHNIKELCRVYVSRSVKCEYCGNQRSMKSAKAGLLEEDYRDLLDFEKSKRYGDREKAALAYTEAITWDLETDDAFWDRLRPHFSEPELVELGYFVAT